MEIPAALFVVPASQPDNLCHLESDTLAEALNRVRADLDGSHETCDVRERATRQSAERPPHRRHSYRYRRFISSCCRLLSLRSFFMSIVQFIPVALSVS